MGMVTPIPKAARPVVWFIRWWVKKPRTLPTSLFAEGDELAWRVNGCRTCPIGFVPEMSPKPWPGQVSIGLTEATIQAFTNWWDSQTDARAAVDAVWGKE